MTLIKVPAIVAGTVLFSFFSSKEDSQISLSTIIKYALTNGSVFLILGSLLIEILASKKQTGGINPSQMKPLNASWLSFF